MPRDENGMNQMETRWDNGFESSKVGGEYASRVCFLYAIDK